MEIAQYEKFQIEHDGSVFEVEDMGERRAVTPADEVYYRREFRATRHDGRVACVWFDLRVINNPRYTPDQKAAVEQAVVAAFNAP